MTSFTAKKSLGQHFLRAPNVVGAMIHVALVEPEMVVLEIGPGKGILTRGLLKAGAKVIAVEKDDRAIEYMKENFAIEIASGKLTLVQDDILEIEPQDLGLEKEKYIIAANIPYYITGEILRKFLTTRDYPSRMILLVQKEVAKRIVAADKKESILSISVKAYGEPKYIDTVPKRFFRPVPKVDSAIILIDNIGKKFFGGDQEKYKDIGYGVRGLENANNSGIASLDSCPLNPKSLANKWAGDDVGINEKTFFDVVRAGFAHKRKILRGNLTSIIPPQIIERLWKEKNFAPGARAENLTIEQWKDVANETALFHMTQAK